MEYLIETNFVVICLLVLISFIQVTADPVRFNITGKDTWQSSNLDSNRWLSSAAVDGCYMANIESNCCTHTDERSRSGWWSVDLGQIVIVNSVKVFNRDILRERLSRFTIYGSISSHVNESDRVQCTYRYRRVPEALKLFCHQPVMARFIIIQKDPRSFQPNRILTLCEVEIEVCPANTYGRQCEQCGHCEDPQCDWRTGDCFGGCSAGYRGADCKSECQGNTYGVNCIPCSENCKNRRCEKFSDVLKCKDGCFAGKTGEDCSMDCPAKTYGIGCKDCSDTCRDSECVKTSELLECSNGCIAGYQGIDCSSECPGDTFGVGCQACSANCSESKCDKFSETMKCEDGCIAGYQGIDCFTACPEHTYGVGCQLCPNYCNDSKCDKFSDIVECTDGCAGGYTGETCTEECPDNTYGFGCELTCSPNCQYPPCDKFSATGVCTGGCLEGFQGDACLQVKSEKDGTNTGVVAGAVVAALVGVVVVVIIVIFLRRRHGKMPKRNASMIYEDAEINVISVSSGDTDIKSDTIQKPSIAPKPISHKQVSEIPNLNKGNETDATANATHAGANSLYANVDNQGMGKTKSPTLIMVKDLRDTVQVMDSQQDAYKNEYETIPGTTSSVSDAEKPELKSKNRYKNVLPYNHNRVLLKVQNGNDLTDYINASFIKDYHGKVSYIAALGSTTVTIADTWRMIWDHEINSIFMVTRLVESEKMKCEQYWSSQGQATYGDITVILEQEIQDPNIVIRKFKILKGSDERAVIQYHYLSWPDKKLPLSVTSVMKLRKYLKEERIKNTSPILIHCSAGIGRTGTLIALDILLDQMDAEAAVDIKQCVTALRHQRTQMVQTVVQYKFLFHCMNEISTLGCTAIPVGKLEEFLNAVGFKDKCQEEYQFLEQVKPVFSKEETAMGRDIYRHKNRDSQVIPSIDHRVKLELYPEIYINAVYVRGYMGPKAFCATQWPLEVTEGDFWKMIFQEKSAAIVCMEKLTDKSKLFNKKGISLSYDDISVSVNYTTEDKDTEVYDILIEQNEVKDSHDGPVEYANVPSLKEHNNHQLKMVVLKCLPNVRNSKTKTTLIPAVYQHVQSIVNTAEHKIITVTCRNGAKETGLYIGASILFDMINKEQQVDVVQVVKQIRTTRPEFITNQEQYEWLYTVCAAYLNDLKE